MDLSGPWGLALVLACAALALLGALVYLLARALARIAALERSLSSLSVLEPTANAVLKLAGRETELDLRRLEHVLIDLRDGQRRTEDRLLSMLENQRSSTLSSVTTSSLSTLAPAGGAELQERILTRLLALGYERIVFVTSAPEIAALPNLDGPVLVEARRDGVACKGRVILRAGSIHDVQMQSAFAAFP